jgi:hypothetical protein
MRTRSRYAGSYRDADRVSGDHRLEGTIAAASDAPDADAMEEQDRALGTPGGRRAMELEVTEFIDESEA